MPAVILFNRKLPLASDDFLIHGFLHFLVNFVSVVTTGYLILDYNKSCSRNKIIFLILQLCVLLLDLITDLLICIVSLKGTIAYSRPRRHIPKLLYMGTFLITAQIIVQIWGIYEYYTPEPLQCRQESAYFQVWAIQNYYVMVTSFVMLFLLLIVVYSIPPIDHNGNIFHHAIAPIFMGTTFIHRNHANSPKVLLGEVAQLMLDLFGVNDLCVSDILVGLVLVRKRQIKQVIDSRTSSMVDLIGKQDLEEKETVDMDEIDSGVAYGLAKFDSSQPLFLNVSVIGKLSRYAEAVYGMPLKMYSNWKGGFGYMLNPRGGTPVDAVDAVERTMDVGCRTIFCCCPGAHRVDDIMHSDLIYISIKGSMFKSPFVVSVDHEHKSVIIATRGTLSTTDLLVDLYFKEEKIKWKYKGESIEAIAHHGIYRITTTILKELKDNRVFAIIQNQFPEYSLVCVGHSLGAAVSSLLAFLIKNDEELALFHSKTTAICYSPPAFTVSRPAIEYFKTFCTSVVFGDDFITRLNTRNIHILKEKIIRELSNCHDRKIDLISSVFMAELFKQSPNRSMGANESLNSIPEPDVPEMMLPGNVLHIKRNFPNASWELVEKENFTSSWVVEGTIEKEIIVSTNMITDHFPNRVGNVLRGLFVNV